ncbi:helix-turn-helix domain-containing protein [Pseudobythopirellula maris]|uniref:helix-turn-helix domain-containing protein n=1 Tax=Pseudobythopirellula maris TaxID=2527991 RepID=UPI0011B41283
MLIDCIAALPQDGPADPGNGELLTVRQAAVRFNLGERTIYRLVEQNALPHCRLGTAIRIKPADLESCLEAQQVRPGSLFG